MAAAGDGQEAAGLGPGPGAVPVTHVRSCTVQYSTVQYSTVHMSSPPPWAQEAQEAAVWPPQSTSPVTPANRSYGYFPSTEDYNMQGIFKV